MRLPNFVKLDAEPFDHATYVGPEEIRQEGEYDDAKMRQYLQEQSASIKLEVENTLR